MLLALILFASLCVGSHEAHSDSVKPLAPRRTNSRLFAPETFDNYEIEVFSLEIPSEEPTVFPASPTAEPTADMTAAPSSPSVPTVRLSTALTVDPSVTPTAEPSAEPTAAPSAAPTNPTAQPSFAPTATPTGPTFEPTVVPTAAPTNLCPPGWLQYSSFKCYESSNYTMPFTICHTYCPTLRAEATNVCIEDAAQNAFLFANRAGLPTYIGYTDALVEGEYKWVNPSCSSTFNGWSSPGVPNGGASENYAVFNNNNGLWSDFGDAGNAYCLCEFNAGPTPVPSILPSAVPTVPPTLVPTAQPTRSPTHMCDSGWAENGCKCYKFFTALVTFASCRSSCAALRPDASMLCVENVLQNEFIRTQIVSAGSFITFLGLTDESSVGTYKWQSTCPSTYKWWMDGNPSYGSEHYGVMLDLVGGKWNDQSNSARCACEYVAGPTPVPSAMPSTPTANPTFKPSMKPTADPTAKPTTYAPTGPSYAPSAAPTSFCNTTEGWVDHGYKCYFLTSLPSLSFAACKTYCTAKRFDATMLCVENAEQSAYINSKISSSGVRLGYTDEVTEGQWLWVPGCSSSYSGFAPPQPDNSGGNQDYGVLNKGGAWDDIGPGNAPCGCEYTGGPTPAPSAAPTNPTANPTFMPTRVPTANPTFRPTAVPTFVPTARPTSQPSSRPSAQPSAQPSSEPSSQPIVRPSSVPSAQPFAAPTSIPSAQPTALPSVQPSSQPSAEPTAQPSRRPTCQPSVQPSAHPTSQPSAVPSSLPSAQPSSLPTSQPIGQPTSLPSMQPSALPSAQPSSQPSSDPTAQPSCQPTSEPSGQPSARPSSQPSVQPSSVPTSQPLAVPSSGPSSQPSSSPSGQPSDQPSVKPSTQPSAQPSTLPTSEPSAQPSAQPSSQPSVQPSSQPVAAPTAVPSSQPSALPSVQPTVQPSTQPTSSPSSEPTAQPSAQPSSLPLAQPSGRPTSQPSCQPSSQPSVAPSAQPSASPTSDPTSQPSSRPSTQPSSIPSGQPSAVPSTQPSEQPTAVPTTEPSSQPTSAPSSQPTVQPSSQPSVAPTSEPSAQPSSQPTTQPSCSPTDEPTSQPTAQPSSSPSVQPSTQPTNDPTAQPSSQPTNQPSVQPSSSPTSDPTSQPTQQPSAQPSMSPSAQPSMSPTVQPSLRPFSKPSTQPSSQPSAQPSCNPTSDPTSQPSSRPSMAPSVQPSAQPSAEPTAQPTAEPSSQPTTHPTGKPSGQPSAQPSSSPSAQPTSLPTSRPSSLPSGDPNSQPSSAPSAQPSVQPTGQPSSEPSAQPSSQPSTAPSGDPSAQPSAQPTAVPTAQPSTRPTSVPSCQPIACPSAIPTALPSEQPFSHPSTRPSAQPKAIPTSRPTAQPTAGPTSEPTAQPTSSPSSQPTSAPTIKPSGAPTTEPTTRPSSTPTAQPTAQPSAHPSQQPTAQPTSQPIKPTRVPTIAPSPAPTMGPTSAGTQVFFDGSQYMNGVSAAEFLANDVIVEAWKATVALSCDRTKADLLRVDVLSVEDVSSRRNLQEATGAAYISAGGAKRGVLAKTAKVNFKVSYTQQMYESTSTAAVTAPKLKASYEQSVQVQTFNADFATEVQKRTADSQEIIETVQPAAVVLEPSYQVIETTYSPTLKPTVSPRPTASPSTHAPTLYWKASTVTSTASTFTSGTISLDVTFAPAATYPGQMYCLALVNNGVVTSVDQVVTGGTAVSYLIDAVSASLVIQGLDALTPYATYCYIETAQGTGNSLEEVQQTRLLHTTACCKSLTFTNTPSSLYGDSSKYPADQTNRFVFSYVLGSAPIGVLDVTPTFVLVDGTQSSLSAIMASPVSTQFVASSTALTGSFIISVSSALFQTGDYNLTLQLGGTSSAEYPPQPVFAAVRVLAADAPPSPPALLSAVFSNSGGSIFVTFDSASNQALSTVSCALLFVFDGAAKATCTWTSNTAVRVKFPAYDGTAFAEPAQLLQLKAGTIKAQCYAGADCSAYAFSGAQSVTIAAPTSPINPTAVISMPRWSTACAVVVVDASLSTGHGGRPWQAANWTVRANVPGTSTSALQTKLNSLGTTLAQTTRFTANAYLSTGVEYTISLAVKNFLGQSSSASVLFTISSNPNLPIVQILGNTAFAVTPTSSVTIFASSGKSVCAEKSVIFSTTWAIYTNNNSVVDVRSTSVNPYVLILPAFSLSPGNRYRAVMTTDVTASDTSPAISASAEAYITVSSGSVVAVVSGGDSRLMLPTAVVSIDASGSYDENVPSSTTGQLTFLWTCKYLTTSRYGASCGSVFVAGTVQSARVSITGTALNSADTYSFTVKVTAPDQRTASKAITLKVQSAASSTAVAISGAPTKINANQRLSLTAQLSAKYGLTGVWSASSGGSSLSVITSTPASVVFRAAAVASGTGFALLVPADQLSEGSTVTFRLTADRTGASGGIYQGYSEVSVVVNAPPTSGTFEATPSTGEALTTSFDLAASGWTDDTADLPLSYMFQFTADAQGSSLVIQSRQSASTVSALLPAGSEALMYAVTLTATIYDNLLASTNTTQRVNVTAATSQDALDTYLADGLNVFQATQDINQATLMVNNIATTINVVNCSAVNATFCQNQNRLPCSTEPGTCSSCLDGYVGVVGSSNARCFPSVSSGARFLLATNGAVGDSCSSSNACQLGSCVDNICVAPVKLCPSSVMDSTCSGNGQCVYSDNTGKVLDLPCTIFDTQCFATCACTNGTAGYDCSLTTERLLSLDATRSIMCSTFLDIAALSNPSAGLLETSVQTLLAAFDVTQTVNASTASVCKQALQVVSALAATDGILSGATTDTVSSLVLLAGQYARTANTTLGWDGSSVDASMANITSGVLSSMVNGQTDIAVATTNLKFVATKAKISDFNTLVAPLTTEEQAYGVTATASLELANGAGAACDAGKGYVDAALTQWGINPFPGVAGQLEAPQIKFESSIPADPATSGSRRLRTLSSDPAYFVTLVYNQPQNLTLDVAAGVMNVTFPECTEYDADTQQYVPCGGCEISTFNNNNVTFVCYDITRLCGTNATIVSAGRRLAEELLRLGGARALASNDDYLDDADGWGTQTSITSIQYSALVSTFVNVLSTNIFRINWRAAKATISMVGILVAAITLGLIYFRAWDIHDHDLFLYKYKELPHQRLKKINQARSIKLKRRTAPPAKNKSTSFSFSMMMSTRRLNLHPLQGDSFARQPSAAFDIWDEPAESEELGTCANPHINLMKRAVSYDPVHEILDSKQDIATIEGAVDSFIRSAIPIRNLDGTPTDKLTTAMDILRKHPVFNLFFEANLQVSRVQRFTQICIEMLCGLFVDTLFFSTFYPSDGECEIYKSEASCLEPQNTAVSANLCRWSANANVAEGGACGPQAPPSDVTFMMILVMITLIITVPLSFVFDFVMTEYCSKRPDFDEWGYSTENLLGRSTQSLGDFASEKLVSPIIALRREVERSRAQLNSPVRFHSAAYLATPHPAEERDQKKHGDAEAEGRAVYHELIGVQEEVDEILRDAIKYLTITVRNQNVPWKTSVLHGSTAATALLLNREKVRAIEKELGVRSDATPMRLSLYNYVVYGSQTNKLLHRIRRARIKAMLIHKTLEELGESELLSKDQALTQFFILEQFSVFKQYALRSALFSFSVTSALPIDPTSWILGWMFIIGALIFFVYWILAWGINTADVTIETWGVNFAIGTVQELILIQTFRLYVIYMISTIVIKPQLAAIYRTLQRLAIEYIQDELPDGFGVIKVVQHISPACRVARLKVSDSLAAGQILRQIDDSDIHSFRRASHMKLPIILFTVVAIPVVAGLLNDATGDITLNSVLPSAFSMIILGHVLLWQISPLALIMPYVAVIIFLLTGGYVFNKAEERVQRMRARAEARVGMKALAGWQKRYRTTFNSRMTYLESFTLYVKTHATRNWNIVVDGCAAVAYYAHRTDELGEKVMNFVHPHSEKHVDKRLWRSMNMPDFLHGRIISSQHYAATISILSQERIESPELPERVMRMTADVAALWAEQGSPAPPQAPDNSCSGGSQSYVRSLLTGEDWTLLVPAAMSEEHAEALPGEVLQETEHTQAYIDSPVAARFKEKYGFHPSLEAAVCKVLKSFQNQLRSGSLYFLSLEDEQKLFSAADASAETNNQESELNRSSSALLKYSGQVHVRDVALMLEEILYFYRPHGAALTTATVRDVLSRYDEWVVGAVQPLDLELLAAAGHLLNCQSSSSDDQESDDGAAPYSHIVERGHFQQHQLVSLIHFGKLAKELKPPSPVAQSPRRSSMARVVRVSSTWSDIRIVLDDEAARLREAETGIMSTALRSLNGKQKLSIASRMEAKKRQEQVKVHIAHATVPFDAFVAFLRSVLPSAESIDVYNVQIYGASKLLGQRQPLQLEIADTDDNSSQTGDQELFDLPN